MERLFGHESLVPSLISTNPMVLKYLTVSAYGLSGFDVLNVLDVLDGLNYTASCFFSNGLAGPLGIEQLEL